MKKVVFISWRDSENPEAGGAEVYNETLAKYLASNGYDVELLVPGFSKASHSKHSDDIKITRVGGKYTSYIFIPWYFVKNLRAQTDLLIENFNGWPYLVPLLSKRSLIMFMHLQDEEWFDHFTGITKPLGYLFKYGTRFILKTCYRSVPFATISESSKNSILGIGLTPKILEFIHPGVDDKLFDNLLTKQQLFEAKSKDKFIINFVGRLAKHKRPDVAVDLVHRLVEAGHDNLLLKIAGRGELEADLKARVDRYGLQDYVEFLGFISEEEKRQLMEESHLHIQPSKFEGWGITVVEAAAAGTPSIGYKVPGLVDSIGGTGGYLVDDNEELYNQVLEIIKSRSDIEGDYWLRAYSSQDLATQYSWSSQCKKFEGLVSKLLSN